MSAGVLPLSNIGYSVDRLNLDTEAVEAQHLIKMSGDGGLHKVYTGIAFLPLNNLSLGVNVGFLWGKLKRNTNVYFPNITGPNGAKQTAHNTTVSLKGVTLDFGAQYIYKLSKSRRLTFGAVYSPKISLKNDVEVVVVQNVVDINKYKSSYDLAASYGFGVSYQIDKKFTVSTDVLYQKWSDVKYFGEKGVLSDLTRIGAGVEFLPNYFSRNYFAKVKYRFGAHIANPYYKIDGVRASKEFGVSAGFGLPLPQGKSQLNVSAELVRVNGQKSRFVDETMFRINLGLVFNEKWFFKRKI